VLYLKDNGFKKFIIIDGSMTELIRPALYQASHVVQNLSRFGSKDRLTCDVVGPICESSDVF